MFINVPPHLSLPLWLMWQIHPPVAALFSIICNLRRGFKVAILQSWLDGYRANSAVNRFHRPPNINLTFSTTRAWRMIVVLSCNVSNYMHTNAVEVSTYTLTTSLPKLYIKGID